MQAFSFRLDRVLNWRISLLKAEKAKIETLRAQLEAARLQRAKLVQDLLREKQSACQRSLSGAELQTLDAYALWVDRELMVMDAKIQKHMQAVDVQQQVVIGCDRNVRLLDRLRGRRKVEWQEESDREMEALASDFSAGQWIRNRHEEDRKLEKT